MLLINEALSSKL